MSQDLFAAFGSKDTTDAVGAKHTGSIAQADRYPSQSGAARDPAGPWVAESSNASSGLYLQESLLATGQHTDDGDDFGDFEDARASDPAANLPRPVTTTNNGKSKVNAPTSTRKEMITIAPKVPIAPKGLPFTPKVERHSDIIGKHPFAGAMDLLFEAGDDDYDAGEDELGDLSNNPEAAMAYSKRIIAEQEASQRMRTEPILAHSEQYSKTSHSAPLDVSTNATNKSKKSPLKDSNVLFDLDNLSEHDDDSAAEDFGDFEDWGGSESISKPSPSTTARVAPSEIDLLYIGGTTHGHRTQSRISRSNSSQDNVGLNKPIRAAAEQRTATTDSDAWDDFSTNVPTSESTEDAVRIANKKDPALSRSPNIISSTSYDEPPPINIPPPLILLSIFPSLFASANDALFDSVSKLDLKQRQMLLSHPASHQFLLGYLSHCTVLARLIAGRKVRWKRDQRLAQSMRIGPSATGGTKGGMKLAGLDKSEMAKEDREVLDCVQQYKAQVGKLRSAVTTASMAPGLPKLPAVPDMHEQMPIKVLKPAEGGITAPHACALCGLRRDERVVKLEEAVEDSFGEWWLERTSMHLGCWNFWKENERKLKSR